VRLTVVPEAMPRYQGMPMTADEIETKASRYYERHRQFIADTVDALSQEWSQIGDSMWTMQNDKLGY